MPSNYTDQQKSAAMEMLAIGDNIAFIHYSTGIPERTLRRWRQKRHEQSNGQMAEKSFSPTTDPWPETQAYAGDRQHQSDTDQTDISTGSDYEDFTYIREQLMQYAREMARNLQPGDPHSNRRTLALSRILDRIQRLDRILPDLIPEQSDDQERPPWQDAFDAFLNLNPEPWEILKAEEMAKSLDERFRGRVYEHCAKNHRDRNRIPR